MSENETQSLLKHIHRVYDSMADKYKGKVIYADGLWCFCKSSSKVMFTSSWDFQIFLENLYLFYEEDLCQKDS